MMLRSPLRPLVLSFGTLLAACAASEPPPPPEPVAPAPKAVEPIVEKSVEPTCEPLTFEVPPLDDSVIAAKPQPLVDPTGEGMNHFYERLARLMRGRAKDHVRIGVYGDSNMTMDWITGTMRRDIQQKLRDGGHGFIALGRPWTHYHHMDVVQELSTSFQSYAVTTKPTGDGGYGYAGIVSESAYPSSKVRISTAGPESPIGKTASRFDVYYMKGPRQGAFEMKANGKTLATLDGFANERSVGVYRAEVPDGPQQFDMVVSTPKWTRLLGGVVERSEPSVVIDSLGVGAMNTRCITLQDPRLAEPMIKFRRYDLVVLMTGTADIFELDKVPEYVANVVETHRKARPGVSFLLVSPPDRGVSKTTQKLLAVGAQRLELASSLKTGHWDLLQAMGGPTSMMTFIRKQYALPDQIHFSEAGGRWVGRRLLNALSQGFADYLKAHPRAGCDEAGIEELEPWPAGSHDEAVASQAVAVKAVR